MDEITKDKTNKKEEDDRAGGLQEQDNSNNANSSSGLGDVAEEVAKALHSTAHVTVAFADPIKAALCIAHLQAALEDFSPTTKATSARDLLNASARSAATSGGVGGTTGTSSGGRSANANNTSNGGGLNVANSSGPIPSASSPVMSDGASEDEHAMRAVNMIMIAYNGVGGGIDGKAAATSAGGRGLKVRCALHYGTLRTRGAFAVSVRSALTAQLRKRQDEELRSREQQVEQLSSGSGGTATRSGHQVNNAQQEATVSKASMYINAQRDLVNGSRAIFGHAERHAFIASQELWQEAQKFYGEGLEHAFELLLLGPRRFMGSKSEEGRGEAGSPSLDELSFCGGETIASKEFMAAVGAHPAVFVPVPPASRDAEGKDVQPFSPSLTIANEICQRLSRSVTAYTSTLNEFDKRGRTFNKIPFLPCLVPTTMEQASAAPTPNPSAAAGAIMSSHSQPPSIVYLLPTSLNYRVKTIGAFVREVMRADEDLKAQTIAELFGPSLTASESPAVEKKRPTSSSSSASAALLGFGYERLVMRTILDRRRHEYTALLRAAQRALLQTGVLIPQHLSLSTTNEDLSTTSVRRHLREIVNTRVQKSFPFASAFLRWGTADGERSSNLDDDDDGEDDEEDEENDQNMYVRGREPAEMVELLSTSSIAQSLNLKRLTRIIAKIANATPLEIIQKMMQVVGEAVSKNFTSPALRQHAAVVASGLATPTMSLAHATQLYQCWLDTLGVDIEHAVALQIDSEYQRGQAADEMLAAVEGNSVEQLHQQNSDDDGRLLVPSSAAGGLTSNMPSLLRIGGAGASSLLRRPQHSFGRGSPLKTAETIFFGRASTRASTINSSEPSSPLSGSSINNNTATAKFLQQIVSAQQQIPTFSIGRRQTNNRGGIGGGAHRNSVWGMSAGGGKLSSSMNRSGQLPPSSFAGVGGGAGAANPAMLGNSTRSVGASDLMLAVSLQQLFRHSCAVSAKAAKVMGYPMLSLAGNPNQFDSRLRDVISLVKSGGATSRGAPPAAPVDINTFHTSALDVVEHTKTVLQATMTALQCRTDRQSCFHRTTQTIIAIPPLDRSAEAESAVYKRVKDVAADGGEVFMVVGVRKDDGDNNNAAEKQTRNSVGTSPPRTAPSGAEGYDLSGGRDGTNRASGNGRSGAGGEGSMPFSADAAKRVLSGAEAMQHAMRRGFRPGADQDITALRLRERRLMELEEELQRVASVQQEMLQQQQMLMNSSSITTGASTAAALLSRTAPPTSSTSLTPAPHIALSLSVGGTATTAVSTPSAAVSEEAATAIARSYFNALTVFNRPPPSTANNTSLLPPIPRQSGAGGVGGGSLALRKGNNSGSGLHAQQQFLNFSGHPTPSPSRQGTVGGLPPISNNTSLLQSPPPQQQQQGAPRSAQGLLQPLALAMNNNDASADDFTVDASFVTISRIDQTRDLRGDLASPFQSPPTTFVGGGGAAGSISRGGVGFQLQSSRMGARRGLLQTGGDGGAAANQMRSGGTVNASHLRSSPLPLGGGVKQTRTAHGPLSPQFQVKSSDGYETVDLTHPPTDEGYFDNGFDHREEEESGGNEEEKGGVSDGYNKSRPTHAANKSDALNGGGTSNNASKTIGAKSVLTAGAGESTNGTALRRKPPSSSSTSTRPKLNKPHLNQGTEDPSIE